MRCTGAKSHALGANALVIPAQAGIHRSTRGAFRRGHDRQNCAATTETCTTMDPALLWLHLSSDSVIAIAYYTIPFALIYFISRRRDLAFRGI